jgi:hypothetical protein
MIDGVRDNIRNWLESENIQYNTVQDVENDYHLHFWFSRGLQLDLVLNNDKITISIVKSFSPTTLSVFRTNQHHFNKLDLELHRQNARFSFLYTDTTNRQLAGFRIFKDIWGESLTKTSFFDAAAIVEHSYYIVEINERELATMAN